jgi:hypothetical protein
MLLFIDHSIQDKVCSKWQQQQQQQQPRESWCI